MLGGLHCELDVWVLAVDVLEQVLEQEAYMAVMETSRGKL